MLAKDFKPCFQPGRGKPFLLRRLGGKTLSQTRSDSVRSVQSRFGHDSGQSVSAAVGFEFGRWPHPAPQPIGYKNWRRCRTDWRKMSTKNVNKMLNQFETKCKFLKNFWKFLMSTLETDVQQVIPSRARYLSGMETTDSPKGLLPLFPSWSCMKYGAFSAGLEKLRKVKKCEKYKNVKKYIKIYKCKKFKKYKNIKNILYF